MHRVFSNPLWLRFKGIVPHALRDRIVWLFLFSDRSSRNAYRASQRMSADGVASVRLRQLGGRPLEIRRGTDDPWELREVFTWRDQLPPPGLNPRLILDLGANIGGSMALLASRFPDARIVGVEPDPDNARLCRRNVAAWGSQCEVLEAAVWPEDGKVHLAGCSTSSYTVQMAGREVVSVSLSTLVERYGPADYVKVDIEGAEQELFSRNTEWANSVACLAVEVHGPYSIQCCIADLTRLGYEATLKAAPRQPRVVAVRN